MLIPFEASQSRPVSQTTPAPVNPIQWHQSLGLARQICARVFRDGGRPEDAAAAFGLTARPALTWDRAVEAIAAELSRTPSRKAA
jgi:hypothetical protein